MIGLEENIKLFAEEFLSNSPYFLVDIVRGSANKKTKISVFIDADTSVSVNKCAELSRHITGKVEEELAIEDAYIIEVSSAGVDRPLILKRQYIKNIGRNVEVVLLNGQKEKGKLSKVNDQTITLVIEKTKKEPEKELIIENNNIKSTKVLISF